MDISVITTVVEYLEACEGQPVSNIRLATAHRNDAFAWETLMRELVGEDGFDSVKEKILAMQEELRELREIVKNSK